MAVRQGGTSDAVAAQPPLRETRVAQVMTSTSVGQHPTAFRETGLPILRVALDVDLMGPVLAPLLAPLSRPGETPHLRYARLMAYKKGHRGTIQYEVTLGGRPVTVLGKFYPQPAQVGRVDAILRDLWGDVFADHTDLGVPRPLGGVLDLSMLVYVPVEGTPLDEVILETGPAEGVRQTAEWLARLHAARIQLDRRVQITTELANLEAWAAVVTRTEPQQGAVAEALARDLARRVDVVRLAAESATSPVHKDFHYKHVLAGAGAWVIDFDEVRYGDPMYDVAHFGAHLRLLGCRNPEAAGQVEAAEQLFLDSYARATGRPIGPTFAWYATYTCVKIAKQLCSVRGVRPRPDGEEMLRQLTAMLEQGIAFRATVG